MSNADAKNQTRGRWHKLCLIQGRLDGKIAIVTGSDRGLGFQTTAELARRGAIVIMACLNLDEGQNARKQLLDRYGLSNSNSTSIDIACPEMQESLSPIKINQLIVEQIDLASLMSIRQFVQRIRARCSLLHYLINNAGLVEANYSKTEDNLETNMGVNFLGPFLLTELLIPLIVNSVPARIIFISSIGHRWVTLNKPDLQLNRDQFDPNTAYCQSKLAVTIYAKELGRRLRNHGVWTASVDPGFVRTALRDKLNTIPVRFMKMFGKFVGQDPWHGVQTIIYTILKPDLESGEHYRNCELKKPAESVLDEQDQNWLIERARQFVAPINI